MENKVPNGVSTLDRVFVTVESGKEPGVLASDEFARGLIRPEHVLIVGHQLAACFRHGFPSIR